MVPAEGEPKILKLKSSWHRRPRSQVLAVSLKHWKGRRGGGGGGGGYPPLLLRCTAVLMHPSGGGGSDPGWWGLWALPSSLTGLGGGGGLPASPAPCPRVSPGVAPAGPRSLSPPVPVIPSAVRPALPQKAARCAVRSLALTSGSRRGEGVALGEMLSLGRPCVACRPGQNKGPIPECIGTGGTDDLRGILKRGGEKSVPER